MTGSGQWLDRLIGSAPIAGMAALVLLAGWSIAGWAGAIAAAALQIAVLLFRRDRHAHQIEHEARGAPVRKRLSPHFAERFEDLGERSGLGHAPALSFIDGAPNAFAWQPRHRGPARLVVSESLHDLLSERQLLAVLAHEIAHIRAGDGRRLALGEALRRSSHMAALIALFTGAAAFIVQGQQLAPNWAWWTLALGPTALSALHHAISRRAEFRADAEAARLTGDPAALSQALARIQFATSGQNLKTTIEEFAGIRGRGWWRTHPAMTDRIDRLQRAAGRQRAA